MLNPQLNKHGELQHLLTIEGLPKSIVNHILDTASSFVGISDRVGSLEVGKDADIAIFEGNPLRDIQCKTKAVFVNGQQVSKG